MSIDMFPRTIENRLKIGRYVPILRHQSARIEPCGVRGCDVKESGVKQDIWLNGAVLARWGKYTGFPFYRRFPF